MSLCSIEYLSRALPWAESLLAFQTVGYHSYQFHRLTKICDIHDIKPEKVPSGLDRGSQPYSRAVGTAQWLGMKEQRNKRAFRYAIIAYLTAG